MIVSIEGILTEVHPLIAIIENNGLSYEIHIPITTTEQLPALGSTVRLFTHVIYREDQQSIYGFVSKDERACFRLLVEKVSGIGPKTALGILSQLSVSLLRGAIVQSDVGLLSKCPGIGKKTAERMVIELRDKMGISCDKSNTSGVLATTSFLVENSPIQDAVAALVALGFKLADADKAIRKASSEFTTDASAESLIKKALAGSKASK